VPVRRSLPIAPLLAALAFSLALAPAAQAKSPTERIIRAARVELRKGVKEVPDGSNDSPDIARYRTAFPWKMPVAAWCGYFVSYVTLRADVPLGDDGEGIGSVSAIRDWARRTGRWRTRGPRRGDLWIKRNVGHVGIVERVVPGGIVSLDGNWDNRVAETSRSSSDVLGFVRLVGS
jgi:hypothetical protein